MPAAWRMKGTIRLSRTPNTASLNARWRELVPQVHELRGDDAAAVGLLAVVGFWLVATRTVLARGAA